MWSILIHRGVSCEVRTVGSRYRRRDGPPDAKLAATGTQLSTLFPHLYEYHITLAAPQLHPDLSRTQALARLATTARVRSLPRSTLFPTRPLHRSTLFHTTSPHSVPHLNTSKDSRLSNTAPPRYTNTFLRRHLPLHAHPLLPHPLSSSNPSSPLLSPRDTLMDHLIFHL